MDFNYLQIKQMLRLKQFAAGSYPLPIARILQWKISLCFDDRPTNKLLPRDNLCWVSASVIEFKAKNLSQIISEPVLVYRSTLLSVNKTPQCTITTLSDCNCVIECNALSHCDCNVKPWRAILH